MKIENLFNMDNIFRNKEGIFLKEGDLMEGKILEIIDEIAILEVKELGTIRAGIQGDLRQLEGKSLIFTVKTLLPDKLELAPIIKGDRTNNMDMEITKDEYLASILKDYDLEQDPLSIEFLDSLIKYNISINRDNLENGLRILDKLEQIMNITEEEVLLPAYSHDGVRLLGDEDIRKFFVQTKDENTEQLDVFDYMKREYSYLLERNLDSSLIKIISIFIKYKIKPSMNNISYFIELVEKPQIFSDGYRTLESLVMKKFTKHDKEAIIKSGEANIIEQNIMKHKNIMEQIAQLLKYDKIKLDENTLMDIEELQNKLEFLQELREHLNIVFLPLTFDETMEEAYITLIRDKRKRENPKGLINIYINLQTNRLGNIDISLRVIDDKINILFGKIKEEDIILFKNREKILEEMVKTTGYSINNIDYLTNRGDNILDYLIVNPEPIYNLDVQV